MNWFKRKKLPKDMQRIYDAENKRAIASQMKVARDARIKEVKGLARRDAEKATRSSTQNIMGTMKTIHKGVKKGFDNIDMEKFEAHVTGVSKKKKK